MIADIGYDATDYFPAYGYLGILLPEGWTVKDTVKYKATNYESGYFCYNNDVVSFLESYISQPPAGYYWWGANSNKKISLTPYSSGNIDLTILTDGKTGQFNTKYILGDDTDWNKMVLGDLFGKVTESTLMQIKSGITTHNATSWKNEDWEVYPNPSIGQITIRQGNFSETVVMKIYDLNGRLQKSEILHESTTHVNLGNLSKGTYILSLDKKGEVKTKRIIIE